MRERNLLYRDEASQMIFWDTPSGRFWTDAKDQEVGELPWELASTENGLYRTAGVEVLKGDIVLDCGAHFGTFTRQALNAGALLVVAIEIDPQSIECLSRTFRAEILEKRVILYPKGVSDRDTELELFRADNSGGSGVELVRDRTGLLVPLTTVDSIVRELGLSRVDFIKMDVEGSEQKALRGAKEVISNFKPRMAIAGYHKDEDPIDLPRTVREIDPLYWSSMPRCWIRPWIANKTPIVDIIFFRCL